MAINWVTIAKGIRYREHPTRTFGSHLDRYYVLQYKYKGRVYNEALGWESENQVPSGRRLYDRAAAIMVELRENQRTGNGPKTLSEMREEEEKRNAAQSEANAEEERKRMSLDKFFEEHFKPVAKHAKGEAAYEKECSLYKHWIKPILGDTPMIEIDNAKCQAMLAPVRRKGLSQATILYIVGTLSRILRYASRMSFQVNIPNKSVLGVRTKLSNRRTRVITDEEQSKILTSLLRRDKKAYLITAFAFLTGCRFSEAAELKWGDVGQNYSITFRHTKNGTARTIPASSHLIELLSSLTRGRSTHIVFPNSEGNQYREAPQAFKNVIKELQLNEGRDEYDRISFHVIRHTVATRLAENGMDASNLKDIMGWKDDTMALRYVHGNRDIQTEALNRLSGVSVVND